MLPSTNDSKWVTNAKRVLLKNNTVIFVKTSCLEVTGMVLNALKVSLSRSVKNNIVARILITIGNKN